MAEEYYEEAFIGEQFFEEESFEDFWPSDTPQSGGGGGSAQSYNLSVNCIIDTSGYHGSYITEGHSTGWSNHTWGVTPTYSSVSGKFPFLAGDKVSIEKVSFQYAGGNNWFLSDGGCAEQFIRFQKKVSGEWKNQCSIVYTGTDWSHSDYDYELTEVSGTDGFKAIAEVLAGHDTSQTEYDQYRMVFGHDSGSYEHNEEYTDIPANPSKGLSFSIRYAIGGVVAQSCEPPTISISANKACEEGPFATLHIDRGYNKDNGFLAGSISGTYSHEDWIVTDEEEAEYKRQACAQSIIEGYEIQRRFSYDRNVWSEWDSIWMDDVSSSNITVTEDAFYGYVDEGDTRYHYYYPYKTMDVANLEIPPAIGGWYQYRAKTVSKVQPAGAAVNFVSANKTITTETAQVDTFDSAWTASVTYQHNARLSAPTYSISPSSGSSVTVTWTPTQSLSSIDSYHDIIRYWIIFWIHTEEADNEGTYLPVALVDVPADSFVQRTIKINKAQIDLAIAKVQAQWIGVSISNNMEVYVVAEYSNIKSSYSASVDNDFEYRPYRTIKYFDGTSWQDCIVYYFDGSTWNECIPYYFDGTAWNECSSS